MSELWEKIDSDGEYEISNLGRVRKIIDGTSRFDGYKTFLITKAGQNKRISGHRLVAQYFLNNGRQLERWQVVDHLNGDRGDNRLENLRITTPEINRQNLAPVREAIRKDLIREMGLENI
jgi:hypothetical protein